MTDYGCVGMWFRTGSCRKCQNQAVMIFCRRGKRSFIFLIEYELKKKGMRMRIKKGTKKFGLLPITEERPVLSPSGLGIRCERDCDDMFLVF